jgi:hypothetical protein
MYLRDERGARDPAVREKGLQGLYNTFIGGSYGFTVERVRERWAGGAPTGAGGDADAVFAALADPAADELAAKIGAECGPEYVQRFAEDLVEIGRGERDGFSYERSGRGYEPEYIGSVLADIGFTDYRWAPEGRLFDTPQEFVTRAEPYNGQLKTWEFIATR